jgi:SAM-dependent methyltransferase
MPKPGAVVLEIGGGLGYVMEAAVKRCAPRRVIGLDVAPSMIEKAKARLARDGVADARLEFLLYDGVTIPLPDDSVDYVYSVATLQHVPKVYVYNLFLEIKRVLSPGGFCAIHLLSCNNIRGHSRLVPFAKAIGSQLRGEDTHWHHFYAFDELLCVLADGVEARQIDIVDGEVSIWVSYAKAGAAFRRPELPQQLHLARVRSARLPVGGDRWARLARRMTTPIQSWRPFSLGRAVRAATRRLQGSLRLGRSTASSAPGAQVMAATGRWSQDPALLPWYDRPDWAERMPRGWRKRSGNEAAMLKKWCEDGYVVVPGLVSAELIDSFVREIDDVWERGEPIAGLAVSDVVLDDGYHVHVHHPTW